MNTTTIDVMDDGQVVGLVVDDISQIRLDLKLQFERQKTGLQLEHGLSLIRRFYTASPEDRDWFLAHPDRRTRIRFPTNLEAWRDVPQKYPLAQKPVAAYLTVVDRVRPMDGSFLGYEAVAETEAQGSVVTIAEPFHVGDAWAEMELLKRMEDVIGPELFDKAVGAWLASHTQELPHEERRKDRLRYASLFAIAERLCPAHTQAVRVGVNGYPLA